jgi:hypothetical protein
MNAGRQWMKWRAAMKRPSLLTDKKRRSSRRRLYVKYLLFMDFTDVVLEIGNGESNGWLISLLFKRDATLPEKSSPSFPNSHYAAPSGQAL